jgi:hypothetical protein
MNNKTRCHTHVLQVFMFFETIKRNMAAQNNIAISFLACLFELAFLQ